ncbi:MAG: hypothetical protein K1X75_00795 [Leptospirales bacterium]|nr:hypothetical protein [Leptospirales bacterium]
MIAPNQLGPLSDFERDLLAALFEASESDYHRLMMSRLSKTGRLGDVFSWMVARNVPCFVAARFWPQLRGAIEAAQGRVAFAAAEPGWRGRIGNLQSRIVEQEQGFLLQLRKSYWMSSNAALALARSEQTEDSIALVWIDDCSSLPLQVREEAELTLERGAAAALRHFFVETQLSVPADRVRHIAVAEYKRMATQIPRREYSSLAILAPSLLLRQGIPEDPRIDNLRNELLAARDQATLGGQQQAQARMLLENFFSKAQQAGLELPPMLQRMRQTLEGK